jgi:hypothetical protein
LYLGVRGSDNQLRVYDKRREQIDRGRATEEHGEQTRFEAQVRDAETFEALLRLSDPFSCLLLVDLGDDDMPFTSVLLAAYAGANGITALRSRLGTVEFDSYATERQAAASRNLPHPSDVFAKQWPRVVRELLRKLGLGRRMCAC